jgi:parvulin-like peptidyl-prolyl isomerase
VTLTRLPLVFCALHAAATASPDAVAAFRDGSITRSEFSAWRRFLGRSDVAHGAGLRSDVESLVVLRVLAAEAAREGLLETRETRSAERQLARELAVAELRAHWHAASKPTEAEVLAEYEAKRATYTRPRGWLLRNILLRVPAGADREAVRRRAADLRAQAAAGADFGALAAAHSESSTRARKGRIGWVSLDRLGPQVAAAVASLEAGGLSEIIETPEGFTILQCVEVRPAGTTPFDKVRLPLESTLAARRIGERRERALAELRAGTSLEPAAGPATGPEDPVYLYRTGQGTPRPITRTEYETFLRSRDVEPAALTTAERERWRDELLVELGLEEEARRLGLLDTAEYKEKWGFEKLRAAAHEAVAVKARKMPPVTAADVAAFYEANREQLRRAETFHLSAVEFRLDGDTPRALVDRARAVADDLASGELAWDSAAAAIDPTGKRARVRDLGWMTRKAFFNLGASAQAAAEGLKPGGTSGVVQEGRTLMILRMDEERPGGPLSLAEATETITKQIERRRNREAAQALNAEILAAQRIVLLAEQHPAP